MSVIHAPKEPTLDAKQVSLLVVVFGSLLVILLRLWYIQIVRQDELLEEATRMRRVKVEKVAPRGLIFDRNGVPLATVASKFVITAVPDIVKKEPWVVDKVAELVQTDREGLDEKIKEAEWRRYFPTPIFVGASVETASKIAEASQYLPGIGVDTLPMRSYTDTKNFSHLMGYVWTPSDRDLERLKQIGVENPAVYIGKDGIERNYESLLMGSVGGEAYEIDNRGRPKRAVEREQAHPGERLTLGIDARLQKLGQSLLKGRIGAITALDPSNGEVLCLVSSPTFNSKLFEGGIRTKNWKKLRDDENSPLTNRAIRGSYAPGSTFKIVTTIASLMAGKFSSTKTVYCPGFFKIGDRKTKCMGVHGAITFDRAFRKSCNTYFITIGYNAGIENLRKASLACGLGHTTGIDLPAEGTGLVPTQKWLDSFKPPAKWYPGDTVNVCIGQGMVGATPLQMASLAALVANEGVSYKPHLLRSRRDSFSHREKPHEPEILANIKAPASLWKGLKSAMVGVIEDGTAGSARIPGLVWGGKTGSSEHRKGAKTHAWFVGVAPMEKPKIVVAVLLEEAGHGGDVAAPIARAIVDRYLRKPSKLAKDSSKSRLRSLNASRSD